MKTICALLAAQQATAFSLNKATRQLPSLAQVGLQEGTTLEEFNQIQLDSHNEFRADHGAEDLTYDATLAEAAQAYAEQLDATNSFEHSDAAGYGENLAFYSSSDPQTTIDTLEGTGYATEQWYNEITTPGYDFENPGYNTNPGTGHFTQVVWKGSERLGCGVSGSVLVCRYEPAGNFLGEFAANVKTSGTTPDSQIPEPVEPEPTFCEAENFAAGEYRDAAGEWCTEYDLCAQDADYDQDGAACDMQYCTEKAFSQERFETAEGKWCTGYDYCGIDDNMSAMDVYGNDCMNYYKNHLPQTYAELLGAYTATWKYQDGTLIPGDKITFHYTADDLIKELFVAAEQETENTEANAEADEEATGDAEEVDEEATGDAEEATDNTEDAAEGDDGETDETDEAEAADNAEGDSEETPAENEETEDAQNSQENNNNDDDEDQNNGETELVTDIGEGVDECSLPTWMCDLLRNTEA